MILLLSDSEVPIYFRTGPPFCILHSSLCIPPGIRAV
jgi:hypothetical protein